MSLRALTQQEGLARAGAVDLVRCCCCMPLEVVAFHYPEWVRGSARAFVLDLAQRRCGLSVVAAAFESSPGVVVARVRERSRMRTRQEMRGDQVGVLDLAQWCVMPAVGTAAATWWFSKMKSK